MLQLFLLFALTVGITGLAQAQTDSLYRANIPFDFTVAGKTFKAGEYSIKFGFLRNTPTSFLISSVDGDDVAIINNAFSKDVAKPNKNARLVFNKNGDDYALAEIKTLWEDIELYKTPKKQKGTKISGAEVSMLRK